MSLLGYNDEANWGAPEVRVAYTKAQWMLDALPDAFEDSDTAIANLHNKQLGTLYHMHREFFRQALRDLGKLQVDINEARKAVEVLTRKVAQRDEKIRQLSTKGDARSLKNTEVTHEPS